MSTQIADIDIALATLILIAVVVIVAVWQIFAGQRAKARLASDDRYRRLAEQATDALQQTADDIADLKQRVDSVEDLLREVE
jgi:Flp pilus assembly protein TadB